MEELLHFYNELQSIDWGHLLIVLGLITVIGLGNPQEE